MPHPELAEVILEESGYTDMLTRDRSPQAGTRLDNLKELIRAMGEFDTLAGFLEHVQLVMDANTGGDGDQVQILTLHGAKGLEWPMVFLPGWEEDVFPSKRSIDESGLKGLEEERRLAYVGITRARERAYISFVANRQIYGRWQSVLPSRFVDELPTAHVDAVSETGYNPHGGGAGIDDSLPGESEGSVGGYYDSPGWKRMEAYKRKSGGMSERGGAPYTIEGRASTSPSDSEGSGFTVGQRVFHDKFGYGKVKLAEGTKLTVDFEHTGMKKVISTFLTGE